MERIISFIKLIALWQQWLCSQERANTVRRHKDWQSFSLAEAQAPLAAYSPLE
jgi:hypothetical protein